MIKSHNCVSRNFGSGQQRLNGKISSNNVTSQEITKQILLANKYFYGLNNQLKSHVLL
jgi:hypothetical protein